MINIELEKEILKYINQQYRPRWVSLKQEWKDYLLQRWCDCDRIRESYLRIKYNITEIPKCPICGKNCKFYGNNGIIYFPTCGNKKCSAKCRTINSHKTKLERYGSKGYNNQEKMKQTKLEKYGHPHYSNWEKSAKSKDYNKIQEKIKETLLNKYGVVNVFQLEKTKEKSKQTKLDRYGDPEYRNMEKAKETWLKKYGVDHPSKCEEIKNKIVESQLKKYGCLGFNTEKQKQTMIEKYGVDHNWKVPEIHNHCWDDYTLEKRKQTSLEKYGVEHPHLSPIVQEKINATKRKNHTFNTSKAEIESYNLLKEKFHDVIYQYKDLERYPFVCDFYIPSIDTFIECNYHWTHGGKPYEGTIEDEELLNTWKSSNSQYYINAIGTWTVRDVNKRNKAQENNLNWIEFWNIEELKKWLEN